MKDVPEPIKDLKRFMGMIQAYNDDLFLHEHGECEDYCWVCMGDN